MRTMVLAAGAALVLTLPGPVSAQILLASNPGHRPEPALSERGVPILQAVAVPEVEPVVDGRLDEAAWALAPLASDFVQYEPSEGAPATERTEARILYGNDALFVAIRAFDRAPDSIVGQLTRRDESSYSDEVGVIIDSYFDRRTAFEFRVNPEGVKNDVYRFDDTMDDRGWNAVWEVATTRDRLGWTAEFRIPYSQLRFRNAAVQTWGIQFMRTVARRQETDLWAPTAPSESAVVSRFGELRGLEDLRPPRRLEVTPYSLARVRREPGESADPFWRPTAFASAVGADARYGITGDLTLDVTINPDFGQVEADPAEVNLSAYESFLPERRPFFVEGSSLFKLSLATGDGDGATESLFYSRRIGRAPQGEVDLSHDGFSSAPDNTTIMGAWKLSGKTAGGWSVGTLMAVTGEESAELSDPATSLRETIVEPLTTYGVARVQKDFRQGRSALGVIGTAVNREKGVADALELHGSAYAGGVDFRHRFGGDAYLVEGYLMGSLVQGSAGAVARTQRSSARRFQRPDADHVDYDPTRTSLSGVSAQGVVARITGNWRWATGFQSRSPGFEVNDIGYLRESDFTSAFAYGGYDQSTPMGPFRRWRFNANTWTSWSYGGERYGSGGNVNGSFQLANYWSGHGGVGYNHAGLSNGALRGGPMLRTSPNLNGWAGVSSDSRGAVQLGVGSNWFVRPDGDSWRVSVSPNLRWRPSGRASFALGPSFSRNVEDLQWIRSLEAGGPQYLFGRMDQTTVGLTARADYAFSPTLSLQLYAQPFVSAGGFSDFKRVVEPRAQRYQDRFLAVAATLDDDRYRADLDGDGTLESWKSPDFNVRQFQSNAVLRWEYRPGSALFLVWSQGRHASVDGGSDFALGEDLRGLFGAPADDIFMVKVSYWLNP